VPWASLKGLEATVHTICDHGTLVLVRGSYPLQFSLAAPGRVDGLYKQFSQGTHASRGTNLANNAPYEQMTCPPVAPPNASQQQLILHIQMLVYRSRHRMTLSVIYNAAKLLLILSNGLLEVRAFALLLVTFPSQFASDLSSSARFNRTCAARTLRS